MEISPLSVQFTERETSLVSKCEKYLTIFVSKEMHLKQQCDSIAYVHPGKNYGLRM